MRTFLIGEHNPYQDGQSEADRRKFALYPAPDRSAGARLCRVLGLPRAEYLRRFERRNLLAALPWSAPAARAAARRILDGDVALGDGLILLGAKVAAAFLVDFKIGPEPFRPQTISIVSSRTIDCLVLPHPSGRSHLWNDPSMQERVRLAVRSFVSATAPFGVLKEEL